jgi:drug/metabolite transporter (DMT)-like permease
VVEPIFPAEAAPVERRPVLGYLMVLTAATLWAVNGVVAKTILSTGLSALRLSEVRSTGALVGLVAILVVLRPAGLRIRQSELPLLVAFGIGGLALVQWLYFAAIQRLAIGIALLIQYLAPLLVALWARFVMKRHVRRRIWVALVLALCGLGFVVQLGSGGGLSGVGIAASFGTALAFATYILLAERGIEDRDPVSFSAYGFLFAALFWAVIQPWWTFPAGVVDDPVGDAWGLPSWLLMLYVIVFGTIVPFWLLIGALRHVSAPRAAIGATFEPVAATFVAFVWLGESLGATQLAGAALVLAGIVLAQTAR